MSSDLLKLFKLFRLVLGGKSIDLNAVQKLCRVGEVQIVVDAFASAVYVHCLKYLFPKFIGISGNENLKTINDAEKALSLLQKYFLLFRNNVNILLGLCNRIHISVSPRIYRLDIFDQEELPDVLSEVKIFSEMCPWDKSNCSCKENLVRNIMKHFFSEFSPICDQCRNKSVSYQCPIIDKNLLFETSHRTLSRLLFQYSLSFRQPPLQTEFSLKLASNSDFTASVKSFFSQINFDCFHFYFKDVSCWYTSFVNCWREIGIGKYLVWLGYNYAGEITFNRVLDISDTIARVEVLKVSFVPLFSICLAWLSSCSLFLPKNMLYPEIPEIDFIAYKNLYVLCSQADFYLQTNFYLESFISVVCDSLKKSVILDSNISSSDTVNKISKLRDWSNKRYIQSEIWFSHPNNNKILSTKYHPSVPTDVALNESFNSILTEYLNSFVSENEFLLQVFVDWTESILDSRSNLDWKYEFRLLFHILQRISTNFRVKWLLRTNLLSCNLMLKEKFEWFLHNMEDIFGKSFMYICRSVFNDIFSSIDVHLNSNMMLSIKLFRRGSWPILIEKFGNAVVDFRASTKIKFSPFILEEIFQQYIPNINEVVNKNSTKLIRFCFPLCSFVLCINDFEVECFYEYASVLIAFNQPLILIPSELSNNCIDSNVNKILWLSFSSLFPNPNLEMGNERKLEIVQFLCNAGVIKKAFDNLPLNFNFFRLCVERNLMVNDSVIFNSLSAEPEIDNKIPLVLNSTVEAFDQSRISQVEASIVSLVKSRTRISQALLLKLVHTRLQELARVYVPSEYIIERAQALVERIYIREEIVENEVFYDYIP